MLTKMDKHTDLTQVSAADRIRYLIKQSRLTQSEFSKRLGMDPANLSKHLNGHLPVTEGLLNRIAVDMGVSKQWLVDGSESPYAKPRHVIENVPTACYTGVSAPVYDIDVTAGNAELSHLFASEQAVGSLSLPRISPDCVVVKVSGDSMSPVISDGAYIAIRPVSPDSCIFWGQIYVVVLEDYRMVKYLRRNPDDETKVVLRSANPAYDDIDISKHDILKLFLVEAIMNINIRC